jgi:hypothetical protein
MSIHWSFSFLPAICCQFSLVVSSPVLLSLSCPGNYDSIFHACASCAMVCHEWRDGVPAMNPALALAAGAGDASS